MHRILAASIALLVSFAHAGEDKPLQGLIDDAEALRPLVESDLARAMLDEVDDLPVPEAKTIYFGFNPKRSYNEAEYAALSEEERADLRQLDFEDGDAYSTFYGSPMVYARTLDFAAEAWGSDATLEGKRIVDLGYGQLGQLRLWAQMGAGVVGIEVDPILTELYEDCTALDGASIDLVEGSWPNEEACRAEVGTGYDLFVSRNLLKRGYVKPAELNPNFPPPVGWGMSDAEMLGHVFELMNPGGVVVIYSLGPAPDPAKPWSDIANPWPEQAWIDAGFEVVAHDREESRVAREMFAALGLGEREELDAGLFGLVSVYRRPE